MDDRELAAAAKDDFNAEVSALVPELEGGDYNGPVYVCRQCTTVLPRTKKYWHEDSHSPDGFQDICKECRNIGEQLRKDHDASVEVKQAQKRLDDEMAVGLQSSMVISDRTGGLVPSSEVYEAVMRKFGGAEGFAQQLVAQFIQAKPGGAIREKMLRLILQLGLKLEVSGIAESDLREMTDDDMHDALKQKLRLFAKEADSA